MWREIFNLASLLCLSDGELLTLAREAAQNDSLLSVYHLDTEAQGVLLATLKQVQRFQLLAA